MSVDREYADLLRRFRPYFEAMLRDGPLPDFLKSENIEVSEEIKRRSAACRDAVLRRARERETV